MQEISDYFPDDGMLELPGDDEAADRAAAKKKKSDDRKQIDRLARQLGAAKALVNKYKAKEKELLQVIDDQKEGLAQVFQLMGAYMAVIARKYYQPEKASAKMALEIPIAEVSAALDDYAVEFERDADAGVYRIMIKPRPAKKKVQHDA